MEVPLAGESRTTRREVLLAVIIALSVVVAFAVDAQLESRMHRSRSRAASQSDLWDRPGSAEPVAATNDPEPRAGPRSTANP